MGDVPWFGVYLYSTCSSSPLAVHYGPQFTHQLKVVMYIPVSRRGSANRKNTNRRKAAYKAKKQKRRVNRMQGRKLGRRVRRNG